MTATVRQKKQPRHIYPPHAPAELCAFYETKKKKKINHYVNLLGTILGQNDNNEHKAMEGVWKELTHPSRGMTGQEAIRWFTFIVYPSATRGPDAQQYALKSDHADYVKRIKQAAAGPFVNLVATPDCPKVWAKLTQREKSKRIVAIAEAASKLHTLLEHTPFDRSVFRYIGDTNAKCLLQFLRPEYLAGADQGSMSDAQFLEGLQSHPKATEFLFNLRLLALGNAAQIHKTPKGKQKYRLTSPSTELLGDDFVMNPNIGNADRNYFILQMAKFFEQRFNAHLLGTITTLTSVVFNDPRLTKNAVKTVVRSARTD